eukprot:TRINITY_DN5048_c0_g1_i1.p1 TRINITY_DN5048_c0_g1~~TRINITY_DN5048_c0_g1_i1.p1  ORF type:complete len:264 (+),score=25.03 TRINITY_DN5048_c0_g1_i1:137-928(+)
MRILLSGCLILLLCEVCCAELIVNVSKGSQQANVFRQSIEGNVTQDSITIQFLTPSGEHIKQVTDMAHKVTVTVYTIPGEQDLGESGYKVVCFLSSYLGDLIPTEAVTKLRQRHASAVRVAEEHRGNTVQENPILVDYGKMHHISPLIPQLCREAKDQIYSSEGVLKQLLKNPAKMSSIITKKSHNYQSSRRCGDDSLNSTEACTCGLQHCIWWFPCALKYCRTDTEDGSVGGEHRCGIRTCSKCFTHKYEVRRPSECSWDDP